MSTHDTPETTPAPVEDTGPPGLYPVPRPPDGFRHTDPVEPAVCANPTHDHTTTSDGEGGTLPDGQTRPMYCEHDGLPAHYDETVSGYVHDDPMSMTCPLTTASMNGCLHPAPGVGDRVMFRVEDIPRYADRQGVRYEGVIWTVAAVRYRVSGQMDPETRAQLAAGHAHVIMVGPNGRRVGTTSARLVPADIITLEIITYDATWAARHGRVVRTDPVARGMGRATTVHVDIPRGLARRDRVGAADVVRFAFPDNRPPRDMPAVGNVVPMDRVVWGDVSALAVVDPRARIMRNNRRVV